VTELIVHEGHDGWLFLTGGSNFVTTLYERDGGHLPDVNLRRWRDAIIERKRRCDALGVAYAHVVAPEKLTIYGHKQASPLVDVDLAPAIRLQQLFGGDARAAGWVDLVWPMREQRDAVELYWRSDTHWTPEGGLLAYRLLCESLQLTPNADLATRPCNTIHKIMDLGGKFDPPRWEQIREIDWIASARRIYANAVVRILEDPVHGGDIHVGAHAVYRNEAAPNNVRILLFGDSFAGVGPDRLTAQLAETARELVFVWSANVDWRLVKRVKPDIVITEIAERYMALAPNDRFNLRRAELSQQFKARRREIEARWRRARAEWGQRARNGA
jgi:alginate O-acetyltransferase complex protein AlgJ